MAKNRQKDPTIIDFTRVRGKRASAADIARYWDKRYQRFKDAGFIHAEAEWAADNGLRLRNKQTQAIIRKRVQIVKWFMRKFNIDMEEASKRAAENLVKKLSVRGIDEINLFYEVSL